MDVKDMIAAIKHRNTAENRLAQINEDESYWRQELDNFVDIFKSCKVASFYETALTKRLIMASLPLHTIELRLTVIRNPTGPLHAMESLHLPSIRVVLF